MCLMMNCKSLSLTVYLILSINFNFIQSAAFPSTEEKEEFTSLDNKIKYLKIEGNGPFVDLSETYDVYQETGPFRINHLKTSRSSESLSPFSSGKYSPIARLALCNSQKENMVAVQGDEASKLVFEIDEDDEVGDFEGVELEDCFSKKNDYNFKSVSLETNVTNKK